MLGCEQSFTRTAPACSLSLLNTAPLPRGRTHDLLSVADSLTVCHLRTLLVSHLRTCSFVSRYDPALLHQNDWGRAGGAELRTNSALECLGAANFSDLSPYCTALTPRTTALLSRRGLLHCSPSPHVGLACTAEFEENAPPPGRSSYAL